MCGGYLARLLTILVQIFQLGSVQVLKCLFEPEDDSCFYWLGYHQGKYYYTLLMVNALGLQYFEGGCNNSYRAEPVILDNWFSGSTYQHERSLDPSMLVWTSRRRLQATAMGINHW